MPPPAAGARRADAGSVRLGERDVAGLLLVGEQYGAPYDLLAIALDVTPDRLRGIVARWRRAGYASTGRLGPGPAWCWLTRQGMAVTGLRYPASQPSLGRLAHIRAVLAIRLSLQDSDAYRDGQAWWRCERRIRKAGGWGHPGGHVPDAEVTWPETGQVSYAGECWAIEAELTPKPAGRTVAIMSGLLTLPAADGAAGGLRYDRVVYLTAPAARPVVDRAAAALPARLGGRLVVRDLPPGAVMLDAAGLPADPRHHVGIPHLRAAARLADAGRRAAGDRAGHGDRCPGVSDRLAARLAPGSAAPHGLVGGPDAGGVAGRAGGGHAALAGLGWSVLHAWRLAFHNAITGHLLTALVLSLPVAVPVGLLVASGLWAWRIYAVETGLSGRTASAPAVFDARQWRRASRTARARAAAPGAVPLTDRQGRIVVGTTIRAIGHPWHPVLAIPGGMLGRHQVIIGTSGSGKTTLMLRLWAAWFSLAWARFTARAGARPLLAALDGKGGADARVKAGRARRLLHAAGAQRVAIWPDEASLSLWALPPENLAVTLFDMIESGEGAAAFYADVLQSAARLAVHAPPGPPASAADFLSRLDARWLEEAYAADPAALVRIEGAKPHLGAITLRFDTLLGRLGPALDGDGQVTDADAWYFILEGTREQSVAEAQAKALIALVTHAATTRTGKTRAILLAVDDYSAVAGKVPLSNLYERARSLGMGVQVSAQSWDGLGADDTERKRIVGTADGGVWMLRTPYPEELCALAGTRKAVESAHKLVGAAWGDEGTSRLQHTWTVDPNIARALAPGQAAFIHAGGCTWVHVARARPSPLALTPAPAPAPEPPQEPGRPAAIAMPGPQPASLDDAFGGSPP